MKTSWFSLLVLAISIGSLWACDSDPKRASEIDNGGPSMMNGWSGDLPLGFPTPSVPIDKLMNAEKIELGRHLFYDHRVSGNQTQSCSSCHEQRLAFTDGESRSTGSTGQETPRNSMSLANAVYNSTFTWANPSIDLLEEQIVIPLFGERPVEMGITGYEDEVLARLHADPVYEGLYQAAYPQSEGRLSLAEVVDALGAFTRSLISGNSSFDRYIYHQERDAISDSALRGMDLFFSEKLECHHCHGGFNFSFSTAHQNTLNLEIAFHNTGLYNIGNQGGYPMGSYGVFEITGDPKDMGHFKAPTLRNIEVTAPYMHDGSMETLEEVIRFYEAGGRLIEEGSLAGDGRGNPLKSEFVSGFVLTDQEREDLINFLLTLTDEAFLNDERFADPWPMMGE